MNTRNNWEQLLYYANEELKPTGYSIRIFDYDGVGYFICEFLKNGVSLEVYAENFYENELSDLVTEVWHYVLTEKIGK